MSLTLTKANKLGELLAGSPIAEGLKELILEKLPEMSEKSIDLIISALENEQQMVERLLSSLDEFENVQESEWQELEKNQTDMLDKMVNEEVAKYTS